MMKRIATILLTTLLASGVAQANLLDGKTLGFAVHYPTINTNTFDPLDGNYLVGPGIEVFAQPVATGDFSDTNLLADFLMSVTYASYDFVGWEFFDVNGDIDPFTSVTINPLTNMLGFDASRVTFNDDHIWVNLSGLSADANTFVSLDVASSVAAVPEPASYTLMLAGLGLIGAIARRRRNG